MNGIASILYALYRNSDMDDQSMCGSSNHSARDGENIRGAEPQIRSIGCEANAKPGSIESRRCFVN